MEEVVQTSDGNAQCSNAVDQPQDKSLAGGTTIASSLKMKTLPHSPIISQPPRATRTPQQKSRTSAPKNDYVVFTSYQKDLLVEQFAQQNDCPHEIAEKYLSTNGWNVAVQARGL